MYYNFSVCIQILSRGEQKLDDIHIFMLWQQEFLSHKYKHSSAAQQRLFRLSLRYFSTSCNHPWLPRPKTYLYFSLTNFLPHTRVSRKAAFHKWMAVHVMATKTVNNLKLSFNAKACHRCRSLDLIRCMPPAQFYLCRAKGTTGNDVLNKSSLSNCSSAAIYCNIKIVKL